MIHRLHPQVSIVALVSQLGDELVPVAGEDRVECDTLLHELGRLVDLLFVSMMTFSTQGIEGSKGGCNGALRSATYLSLPVTHEFAVVVHEVTTADGCGRGGADACDVDDPGAVADEAKLGAGLYHVVQSQRVADGIGEDELLPLTDAVGLEIVVVLGVSPLVHVAV